MEKNSSEKLELEVVERIEPIHEGAVDADFEKKTMQVSRRRLVDLTHILDSRRIDWRLLPLMSALYAVSLMDRSNLSCLTTTSARTAGMGTDLNLTVSTRYSTVACLYFVPYILFQLPSNVLLRFFGVRVWLTICVLGWGTAQLGMGFVKTWGQLAVCRVLLGLFEAGFFPALVFVITTWYKRHEVQKRLAVFYLSSIVIGGFSGLIGYAITFLKGKGGLDSWNWIFIIQGILTVVLALVNYLFTVDFPQKNTFLTTKQTNARGMNSNSQLLLAERSRPFSSFYYESRKIAEILFLMKSLFRKFCTIWYALPFDCIRKLTVILKSDWTIWACAFMFMSATMPAYAIGYFVTIILNSMGWGVRASLLLATPPYVFAAISCFIFAWMSDKAKKRAPFIAVQALLTITGITITGFAKQNGPRYLGLFVANAGASGCIPAILAYASSSNNLVSHSKRAVSTAVVISAGGVGGIFATTVFREQDFPRYLNGIWATIGCQILMLVLLSLTSWNFIRKNRLSGAGKLDGPLEGQPATKCVSKNHGYESTLKGVEESLAKFQLGYIDLFLIHDPLSGTERRLATYKALLEAKAAGKIRSVGVSNYGVHHLEEIKNANFEMPTVNQIELHPFCQQKPIVDYCKANSIVIQAYCPIIRGRWENEAILNIATKYNRDPAQILLRWSLQKGYVPLPKSSTPNRIHSNANLYDFELTAEEMSSLDALDRGKQGGISWNPVEAP
ncbi:putative transporter C11D3.18C [Mycena sanguinolenta]|uniref:Putative transporter C11D3.18C n=1 Tax=Mycena sanguinolenta TaxID=230812 RepID=A0A8H6ZF11_9AGAR|nr:putative transporter C11D3.18C [Mycena sanguinolenta]